MADTPSPAPMTRPCGCGRWKRALPALLEGHTASVFSVAWSPDGRQRLLRSRERRHPGLELSESHAGKLPRRLLPLAASRNKCNTPTPRSSSSAKAAWARQGFPCGWRGMTGNPATRRSARGRRSGSCPWPPAHGVEREIWLWDFGGQADQRLIHQLYMDETALAVLVFDGQKEDLFETLGQWDRDLTRASRKEFAKLLVGGPRGCRRPARQPERGREVCEGARVPRASWKPAPRQNIGCEELKQAILAGIDWDEHPVAHHGGALQAAQGGDHPPQGRRPGADAVQRAARDAATAAVRRSSGASRTRN